MTSVTNSHPLDPLSADEIRQAAAILRRDRTLGASWRFASIELKEPSKDDLPALEAGPGAQREAIVVCWDRADGQASPRHRVADRRQRHDPGSTCPASSRT